MKTSTKDSEWNHRIEHWLRTARIVVNHDENDPSEPYTAVAYTESGEVEEYCHGVSKRSAVENLQIKRGELPCLENRESGTINMKVDGVLLSDKSKRPSSAEYIWALGMMSNNDSHYGYIDEADEYGDEESRSQMLEELAADSDSYARSSEEGWYYDD